MKKIIIGALGLGFGVVVLVASLFHESRMISNPEPHGVFLEVEYSSDSARLNEHMLPYPGILPDNPLYSLKMLRDKGRLLGARSPKDKLELLVLYADKRIGAAYYLAVGNKVPLAYTTLLKAEHYMGQAIDLWERDLRHDNAQRENLEKVMRLHLKLTREIMQMVEGDARVQLEKVFNRYQNLMGRVSSVVESEENVTDDDEMVDVEKGYL